MRDNILVFFLKFASACFLVGFIVLGFFLGANFATLLDAPYLQNMPFNWVVALIVWGTGLIGSLVIFAIGEIIDRYARLENLIREKQG